MATADHGSMTAAAAALYVAQPALSRAIRHLEREVDVTLFRRSGRSVVLTSAGADFARRARSALASIDALHAVASDGAAAPLVIAASPTLQATLAVPLLAALRDRGVRVPTRLVGCSSSAEVADLVTGGSADLGLCDSEVPDTLPQVHLGRAEVMLYAPAAAGLPERLALADLDGLPLVLPTTSSPRRRSLDEFFAGCGVQPVIAVETDERHAWLATVSAGLASCIWHSVGSGRVPIPGVRAHHFDPPLHRTLTAIHRAGDESPVVARMLDALQSVGAVIGVHGRDQADSSANPSNSPGSPKVPAEA